MNEEVLVYLYKEYCYGTIAPTKFDKIKLDAMMSADQNNFAQQKTQTDIAQEIGSTRQVTT
ncbi:MULTISPECIES: hypothetical protein [Paenibacillus]|uniref:hypothetical protein n=1 Tax=Paenibacillus TaxID=44249 RepID=UPI0011C17864|nr:hypothetical protein [Paenibacillus jamilae]MEE4581540.1 hypothetical protein [Paenibacillus polymyxa]